MQAAVSLEKTGAKRLCEHILGLDSEILFTSIISRDGDEIASASKPSVPLLIGMAPQLRETYTAAANTIVGLFKRAELLLGELAFIVGSYKALNVVIVNLGEKNNAMAVLVTTKDLDSKNVTYQISRVTRNLV
ncbi:MAG: hypothetical protein OK457_02235 [Thaumarchaeota archaeon]|nr:hypothetical protein [Nitrososphaerota archaeon]